MYTETRAFSNQSFKTLFKDAIARDKSKLHQQTDSKKFSKISGRTKKIWQKLLCRIQRSFGQTGTCYGHTMDFRFLCKIFSKSSFFLADDF